MIFARNIFGTILFCAPAILALRQGLHLNERRIWFNFHCRIRCNCLTLDQIVILIVVIKIDAVLKLGMKPDYGIVL